MRAAPAFAAALLIGLLTYLGPLLRCLERYRWWARGLSQAEPVNGRLGAAALPVSWRERAFSVSFWTREWPREGGDPRRSPGGGGGAQVLRRGGPGMEHVGPRGAGGALVAGPRHGGHRVSRRRAAGPPRQDGPARLARDPGGPRGRDSSPPPSARSFASRVLIAAGAAGVVLAAGAFAREALNLGRMLYAALHDGRAAGQASLCAAAGAAGSRRTA